MPLTQDDVGELVALYKNDESATVEAVAEAYQTTSREVRKHLRAAGVEERKLKVETDEDLGIGEDEPKAPVAPSMDDLLNHPAFAAAVEAAVQAKLSEMRPAASESAEGSERFGDFMKAMERFVEAQEEQRPGYQKPVGAEELARRREGRARMLGLIAEAKSRGLKPHYIVGPGGFYGPSPSGPILFGEGQEIISYLPPAEDFLAKNEVAAQIIAAHMEWLGEPTPEIGQLIAQAMLTAKGAEPALVTSEPGAGHDGVELVAGAERHDVRPRRVLGTAVPEQRGGAAPKQTGITGQPAGPFMVGEAA